MLRDILAVTTKKRADTVSYDSSVKRKLQILPVIRRLVSLFSSEKKLINKCINFIREKQMSNRPTVPIDLLDPVYISLSISITALFMSDLILMFTLDCNHFHFKMLICWTDIRKDCFTGEENII